MKIEEILKKIDEDVHKPMVTPTFGDNWRTHARKFYDIDSVINIAWKQGRRAILLEEALREALKK